jgi:hypothetical protein
MKVGNSSRQSSGFLCTKKLALQELVKAEIVVFLTRIGIVNVNQQDGVLSAACITT